jgi:hypothetical protein
MAGVDTLYDRDFYAWTKQQAKALQRLAETRPNEPVDWEHLIEEVADLGKSERDSVRSQLRRIMVHLLKLQHSPAREPRPGWIETIGEARSQLEDKLTPTLRADGRRGLAKLYDRARLQASRDLQGHGESEAAARLPDTCPYTLEQLTGDWWPDTMAPAVGSLLRP